jgi:hypothetical protein
VKDGKMADKSVIIVENGQYIVGLFNLAGDTEHYFWEKQRELLFKDKETAYNNAYQLSMSVECLC